MSKVFVGNLSWGTDNESLRSHFSQFGDISECIVLLDRETGRSRGFGFVTFANADEADAAIKSMNDQEIDGRQVRVNLANERGSFSDRPARGGFRGRGRGGFRGQSDF